MFGDKCPLTQLSRVIDRYDSKDILSPHDYYNFMVVLNRFTPEVKVAMSFYSGTDDPNSFMNQPGPELIVNGWDPE